MPSTPRAAATASESEPKNKRPRTSGSMRVLSVSSPVSISGALDEFAAGIWALPSRASISNVATRMPRLRSSFPGFVHPMTAKVVAALPEGPEWMYEVKLDGYRALLLKHDGRIRILSRNEKPLSYPEVEAAARLLKAKSVVLDGEIVALDRQGRPSFQALQHRTAHPRHAVVFYAFDVLHLNGEDLTRQPLDARRVHLPTI